MAWTSDDQTYLEQLYEARTTALVRSEMSQGSDRVVGPRLDLIVKEIDRMEAKKNAASASTSGPVFVTGIMRR